MVFTSWGVMTWVVSYRAISSRLETARRQEGDDGCHAKLRGRLHHNKIPSDYDLIHKKGMDVMVLGFKRGGGLLVGMDLGRQAS